MLRMTAALHEMKTCKTVNSKPYTCVPFLLTLNLECFVFHLSILLVCKVVTWEMSFWAIVLISLVKQVDLPPVDGTIT